MTARLPALGLQTRLTLALSGILTLVLLILGIEDDGAGIPPGESERVFDRFHRTAKSRTRTHGGSGLGLAIAQAIITEHGGRIWAERAPSGGARVAFELPGFQPA